MKPILFFYLFIFLLTACSQNNSENKQKVEEKPEVKIEKPIPNKFSDEKIRKIYTFQDERNTDSLLPFLKDSNAKYRAEAAMAFASIQDTLAISNLKELFKDSVVIVRKNIAYALGQMRSEWAVSDLIKGFISEKDIQVKNIILESIGKTGGEGAMIFFEKKQQKTNLQIGEAWGIYRLCLTGKSSVKLTERMVKYLESDSDSLGFIASHYLARAREIDLNPHYEKIISAYEKNQNNFTKMALTRALGKCNQPEVLGFLNRILFDNESDYRIKVNAVNALKSFTYDSIAFTLKKILTSYHHKNINLGIAASEFVLANGDSNYAVQYFDLAKIESNYRVRNNLLAAALKYEKEKYEISNFIQEKFRNTPNEYEKAGLIKALGFDLAAWYFIEKEIFNSDSKTVTSTHAVEAFTNFSNLDSVKNSLELKGKLLAVFKRILIKADQAQSSLVAIALRNPENKFKEIIGKNTQFLKDALANLKLPEDMETFIDLQKTIDYFEEKNTPIPKIKNHELNWDLIQQIPQNQLVNIETSKGNVVFQLLVNEAPGSVASFVKLIQEGFYKGFKIHRVVPNFVVQDGCPRGDGWGSPDFSIRSEFPNLHYQTGMVGMASAGKDTEGCQWFITHSPMPHLDGRYSIFARVVSGMDVVHQLEVGDEVLGYEILNWWN